MKKLPIIFIVLLFALLIVGQVFAVDRIVFVSPTGTNTSPYDTWDKAANLPDTAVTYLNGQTRVVNHTMYIAPSTYTSTLTITDADMDGARIYGTAAHGSTVAAAEGQVIIESTGTVLSANRPDLIISDITLQGTGSDGTVASFSRTGGTFTRLVFNDSNDATIVVRLNGASGNTFNYCKLKAKNNNCFGIATAGTTPGSTFNYCYIGNNTAGKMGYGVFSSTSGADVRLNNCLIMGLQADALYATAGTITARNSIIVAGDSYGTNRYVAKQSGTGAIDVDYSILVQDWRYPGTLFNGTVTDGGHNLTTVNPMFTHRQRKAIVVPCTDDASGYSYADSIASVWAAKGVKGTWYVSSSVLTGTALTTAQTLLAGGYVEIGSHSRTHNDPTYANSFSVSKSGATIAIDRTADTITVNAGGTVTGFKAKTIGAIVTELTALGVTCTNYTALSTQHGEVLANLPETAITSTTALQNLQDTTAATGLWKDELVLSKSEIEAALGITVRTYATNYGSTSTNLETAAVAAGYESMRVGQNNNGEWLLDSIDLYQLIYLGYTVWAGATTDNEATVKRNARSVAEQISQTGGIVFFLAHTGETTAEQWGWVIDALKEYPEITITSHSGALDIIKTSPWTTADNRTYTRTWTDQSNYHLKSGSPAINAGVDVGLTVDYEGKPLVGLPDIGAYEYQTTAGIPAGLLMCQ